MEKVLFGALFLFALSSSRHVPFWALCSVPITAKGIGFLYAEIRKDTGARKRFQICYNVLLGTSIGIILIQLISVGPFMTIAPDWAYPKSAVTYLKIHPSKGNLFAEYNWGGYLIWQYPEKKVFIDGRMPSWHNPNAPEGESTSAFRDYNEFFNNSKAIAPFLTKYHVDTVLISPPNTQPMMQSLLAMLGKEPVDLSGALEKAGFDRVYHDNQSVIYRKR